MITVTITLNLPSYDVPCRSEILDALEDLGSLHTDIRYDEGADDDPEPEGTRISY